MLGMRMKSFQKYQDFVLTRAILSLRESSFSTGISQLSFPKKYHRKILAILAVYMDVDAFSPLQTPSYIADMFACMSVVRVSGTVFPWPPWPGQEICYTFLVTVTVSSPDSRQQTGYKHTASGAVTDRAVIEPSRCFTVLGEGPLLVESAYKCIHD